MSALVADTADFKDYLDAIRHSWLKTLCVLGAVLIPLFIVLDYFMIPADKLKSFALYRGVVTVLIGIEYVLLRVTRASRYAPLHGFFFSLTVGLMIALMTEELGGFNSSYYAGLNLVMIAVIVLIPWGFEHAIVNALIIICSYLALNLLFPHPFQNSIFINNLYFLSSSAVISVAINRVHFQLIRKEFYSNSLLKAARKEQDTIMSSVDEGLFIIHKTEGEYLIGEHQSESVTKILGDAHLSGKNFSEAFTPYFAPKKIEELNEYLQMISSMNVDDAMIQELNPLLREGATLQHGLSGSNKVLEFGFKRIVPDTQDADFMISIKDVSKEVEMEHQLRETEIKAEQQSQMMLSILHIGPALLQDFMEGVKAELAVIELVLRDEEQHRDLVQAVEVIFRAVHSLKGNAALLDLKFLAEKANRFEEKMLVLRDNTHLTWEDFLPIAYELAKLQEVNAEMQFLVQRIRRFENKGIDRKSALSALPEAIDQLVQRIAAELKKKVRFVTADFDFGGISNKYAYVLRDIVVQLTRNAVTHGIESPEMRRQAGKDECGTITLSLKPVAETICMVFRDDGKSFDFAAIRERGAVSGQGTKSQLEKWAAAKLVRLIFQPGFSTADEATLHAGRGMGMDIIKQRVRKIGGQLKINYQIGEFTEFKFIFPLAMLKQAKEQA